MKELIVYEALHRFDSEGRRWYQSLSDASFTTEGAGWVVGSGQILRTRDGGRSWVNQFKPFSAHAYLVPNRVFAIDVQRGWVIGSISTSSGRCFFTRDAGETWEAADLGDDIYPNDLFFISPECGWIIADDAKIPVQQSTICITCDEGQTWERRSLGIKGRPNIISFLDATNGLLLADILSENKERYETSLYVSGDGGNKWHEAYQFKRKINLACVFWIVSGFSL